MRLAGRDRVLPSYYESLMAIVTQSWTNVLLVFVPISWVAHFHHWNQGTVFALSFFAILSLQKLFDFAAEEMALYCGKSLGDLIVITLDNAVEITLAIILLLRCELKLLQSTIVGVVLLHLLLATGASFFAGGARVYEQHLNPQVTQLNHSLITLGVMTLLIPTAFFAAISSNPESRVASAIPVPAHSEGNTTLEDFAREVLRSATAAVPAVSDETRGYFLKMSRGFFVILLVVYVASRLYLHNPPGDDNALRVDPHAPLPVHKAEEETRVTKPKMRPLVCILLLLVTVPLMAVTAQWLVDTVEFVRHKGDITEEFFGLILLPFASFSADALMSVVYFIRKLFFPGSNPLRPEELAEGRAIDLSIQFTLFWMPTLILVGWWTHRPFSLLFDLFEVTIVVASCFLVNYVTQDNKTNWAEGLIMISFYVMVALAAWFYHGQFDIRIMSAESCETVATALTQALGGGLE